ncbi:MAG: hypothetical protein ACE5LU_03770 [Anaerolineae bacterium]
MFHLRIRAVFGKMPAMEYVWRIALTLSLWMAVALSAPGGTSAYRTATFESALSAHLSYLQNEQADYLTYLPLVAGNMFGPSVGTELKYGTVVADVQHLPLVRRLGFTWAQVFVPWASVEPTKDGPRQWAVVDDIIRAGRRYNVHLLARVDRPPAWAREPGTTATGPVRPDELERWADFLEALAARGDGVIGAYEIWNEPNLSIEWGGRPPDPGRYAQIIQAAYPAIKRGSPDAVVVSAGMATTGPAGDRFMPHVLEDLWYIERMYQAGAKGYFDMLGTNPHGFGRPPEQDPGDPGINGLTFRRAEQQRAIMENFGDGDRGMWAMEVGWLTDPGPACYAAWEADGRLWQKVTLEQQRDYLVRAYRYAHQHWPWMKAMILFNLDFGAVPSEAGCPGARDVCQETRFYSLVTRNNPCNIEDPLQYRPAFQALQDMPKY